MFVGVVVGAEVLVGDGAGASLLEGRIEEKERCVRGRVWPWQVRGTALISDMLGVLGRRWWAGRRKR